MFRKLLVQHQFSRSRCIIERSVWRWSWHLYSFYKYKISTTTKTKIEGKGGGQNVANFGVVTLQKKAPKKEFVHITQEYANWGSLLSPYPTYTHTQKCSPTGKHKEFLAFQEIEFMATNLLLWGLNKKIGESKYYKASQTAKTQSNVQICTSGASMRSHRWYRLSWNRSSWTVEIALPVDILWLTAQPIYRVLTNFIKPIIFRKYAATINTWEHNQVFLQPVPV